MQIRSFIIAYTLVLAIVLFAERRPTPTETGKYSHIVDLTNEDRTNTQTSSSICSQATPSQTRIIAPDSLIPGTWTARQIPPERLIAPLVVMDLKITPPAQISLDDIAAWETAHGAVPQGAVVAIRHPRDDSRKSHLDFPVTDQAAQFLMDARYITGFVVETSADFSNNRPLARQIALHGNYIVEDATRIDSLPVSGSLIMVAPASDNKLHAPPVRVLAMAR